jgi:hypothetical protein
LYEAVVREDYLSIYGRSSILLMTASVVHGTPI